MATQVVRCLPPEFGAVALQFALLVQRPRQVPHVSGRVELFQFEVLRRMSLTLEIHSSLKIRRAIGIAGRTMCAARSLLQLVQQYQLQVSPSRVTSRSR